MYKKEELGQAKAMIDSFVEIVPDREAKWNSVTFSQKLDRLSELIDVLRFYDGFPEEADPLGTFRPNSIFADISAGKIHFVKSGPSEKKDEEAAQKLMLPLLDYLFSHPGRGRSVLGILRAFVRDYAPHCRQIDFQRTSTGVLRIETNVRFAARELRKFGLLQFTQREAFKTWRLSLLGILAAEQFPKGRCDVPVDSPAWWLFTVLKRLEPMRQMPNLIARLEGLAKRSSLPWAEQERFLCLTMETISAYQKILSPENKTNKHARESEVEKLLQRLNSSPEAESIVCAFDGVPSEQLNFGLRPNLEDHE